MSITYPDGSTGKISFSQFVSGYMAYGVMEDGTVKEYMNGSDGGALHAYCGDVEIYLVDGASVILLIETMRIKGFSDPDIAKIVSNVPGVFDTLHEDESVPEEIQAKAEEAYAQIKGPPYKEGHEEKVLLEVLQVIE